MIGWYLKEDEAEGDRKLRGRLGWLGNTLKRIHSKIEEEWEDPEEKNTEK